MSSDVKLLTFAVIYTLKARFKVIVCMIDLQQNILTQEFRCQSHEYDYMPMFSAGFQTISVEFPKGVLIKLNHNIYSMFSWASVVYMEKALWRSILLFIMCTSHFH